MVSVAALRLFASSCSIWDPVPWLGIELQPPALGVWNLSQYFRREVRLSLFLNWGIIDIQYCISFIYTHDNSVFVSIVKWSPQWVLRNLCTVFHGGCISFHSHQRYTRVPFSLRPCQHLIFFVLLVTTILTDMRWYLIVVLICISLMICNLSIFPFVCWPFLCLLWKKCLFRAAFFSFWSTPAPQHSLHPPTSTAVKVHRLSPWTTREVCLFLNWIVWGFLLLSFKIAFSVWVFCFLG